MKKNKRSFEEFLQIVYSMTMVEYEALSEQQKKAVEIDYIDRYGTPIKWF